MNHFVYEICDDWGWYVDTETGKNIHIKRLNNVKFINKSIKINNNEQTEYCVDVTRVTLVTCLIVYLLFVL